MLKFYNGLSSQRLLTQLASLDDDLTDMIIVCEAAIRVTDGLVAARSSVRNLLDLFNPARFHSNIHLQAQPNLPLLIPLLKT
ncbi:hypothetical protein V1525DRAFT_405127 [Lipomyces kononenkoae]|uniref:Uncharacterized protein n=1 Tax=Lipomyces kononenkoae TaxID=34357 RepID=A0ACC3SZJ6_LIPKO